MAVWFWLLTLNYLPLTTVTCGENPKSAQLVEKTPICPTDGENPKSAQLMEITPKSAQLVEKTHKSAQLVEKSPSRGDKPQICPTGKENLWIYYTTLTSMWFIIWTKCYNKCNPIDYCINDVNICTLYVLLLSVV